MPATLPPSIETRFVGIDTSAGAQALPPGYFQIADNVYVVGTDFVSRPGFVGQLAAKMAGGPIYVLTEYRKLDDSIEFVFVQAGKLWRSVVGSSSAPTEIKKTLAVSFAFQSGGVGVRLVRHGKWLRGIDTLDSAAYLFNVNLETSFAEAYTGLNAPTAAPVVTLTNKTLLSTSGFLGTNAPSSVVNLLLNPGFETGTPVGSRIHPDNWTPVQGTPDAGPGSAVGGNMVPIQGSKALIMDEPNDLIEQAVLAAALPNETLIAGSSLGTRKARLYQLRVAWHCADTNVNRSTGIMTLAARDSSGAIIKGVTQEVSPNYQDPAQWTYYTLTLNLMDLTTDPYDIVVRLGSGPLTHIGDSCIFADDCHLNAFSNPLMVQSPPSAEGVSRVIAQTVVSSDSLAEDTNSKDQAAAATGGQWLYTIFTGGSPVPPEFGTSSRLAVKLSLPTGVVRADGTPPRFRFGFARSTDTVIYWSNFASFDSTSQYITCDCSTIDVAIRQNAKYFFIQLLDDIPSLTIGSTVFNIGGVIAAGNLLVGGSYTYIVGEIKNITTADDSNTQTPPLPVLGTNDLGDVIESSGSPISAAVIPTEVQAQTSVLLAPAVNTTAPTITNWFAVFRGGGALAESDDFFYREIAVVPLAADASGPNWRWDHTTRTFYDNVPDGDIPLRRVYEINRDQFPPGLTALTESNGRLVAAKGATVYLSWLENADRESALYTSLSIDPLDPEVRLKGASFVLDSPLQSDDVTALAPLSTAIVALREHSITHIEGFSPENMAAVGRYAAPGIGCIAPNTVKVDGSGGVVTYLSASGLMVYNLDVPQPASLELQGVLNPDGDDGGPIISAAAYAGCALVVHDLRRYLMAPRPGDSGNTVVYVWDSRQNGWTRWISTATGVTSTFTCAVSLSGSGNHQDLYFGSVDGQIYHAAGEVDKATPAGAAVPIAVSIATRKWGQEDERGAAAFFENRARNYYLDVATATPALALTLGAIGSHYPAQGWSKTYYTNPLPAGVSSGTPIDTVKSISLDGVPGKPPVRGANFYATLQASITKRLRIRAMGLDSSEGRRIR